MAKTNPYGLTNRQWVFVVEYLTDFNGTQAAIRAGYSEKTARVTAAENLAKPNIRAAVQDQLAIRCMGKEETLVRLSQQARFNLGSYVVLPSSVPPPSPPQAGDGELEGASPAPVLLPVSGAGMSGIGIDLNRLIADGLGHLLKAVVPTKFGPRIEFHDPVVALTLIGKHHGIVTEQVEHSWRDEAQRAGLNPDELYRRAVAQFVADLTAGDGADDGSSSAGGAGGGESAEGG